MPSRALSDRFHTLWSSWVVDDLHRSHKKRFFAGDTAYRTVRAGEDEHELEVRVCSAFAEIERRFGGFNMAWLPIGYVSQSIQTKHLQAFTI